MKIYRTPGSVAVWTPAKVNLFLEVFGRRADGFHEVQTVLCPISLGDMLYFQATHEPSIHFEMEFSCSPAEREGDDPAWQIPEDDSNLVVQAIKQVQQRLGGERGCRLRLKKSVPAAAGLGGGSSDAAAAVVASLVGWNHWDRQLATEVCASLGSDVAFFLGDPNGMGIALATGRGEQCQQIEARPQLDFIITHPPVGCSTQAVYHRFLAAEEPRHFSGIVDACQTGQFQKIGAQLFNALQSSASSMTCWIQQQLDLFSECGLEHVLMSGSGSACFALLDGVSVGSSLARLQQAGKVVGLSRVFPAKAWYGDSIEQQLRSQG